MHAALAPSLLAGALFRFSGAPVLWFVVAWEYGKMETTTRRPQGTVGHGAVRRLRFKIRKKSFQGQIFALNSKMDTKLGYD